MHVSFLDPYHHGHSLIHRADARVKLVLAAAFILTAALAPTGAWPAYVLLLALILSVEILTEMGVRYYMKRALLAVPFVLAALPVLFTIEGPALARLPLGLTVTEPGLARFISVGLKSWISVQAAIVLASTTSFPDILLAMRALRLPRLLVAIIGLMWRYLFVMVDEALRMMRARHSRSGLPEDGSRAGRKTGGSLTWRGRVAGGMVGSLFLRSLERSDRIYNAMLARGYDGEVRALPHPGIPPGGWIALVTGLALLSGILLLGSIG